MSNRREFWFTVIGLLVVVVLLVCSGQFFLLETVALLACGWIFYLFRVTRELTVNWSAIGLSAICLVVIAMGLHHLLGWLASSLRAVKDRSPLERKPWPKRGTVRILTAFLFAFVAGMSVVGIAHQCWWLATSPEPLLDRYMEAASRMQSSNNLKQIGLGLHNYHDLHHAFPPGTYASPEGRPLHSWMTGLLPFVEQQRLYEMVRWQQPWTSSDNHLVFIENIRGFYYPHWAAARDFTANGNYGPTTYSANARVLGGSGRMQFDQITDGTANTILAGEIVSHIPAWGSTGNWRDPALGINRDPRGFGSPWRGGAYLMMADGSVRFFSNDTAPEVLQGLATPTGGEKVPPLDD